MLKKVLLVIAAIIVGILLFAATRPDGFAVQRSAVIAAPAEKIFPLIEDFRRWDAWSPYEKRDPDMQRTFSEPSSGVGATYAWHGDNQIGVGRMRITEAIAPSRMALDLDFVEPMEAHNKVEFTLQPEAGGTRVTWLMHGPTPYMAKIAHLFIDMDEMVGGDMEAGLADLKAAAEK
jgi:uncharacterized protein YndB with AHSA1/START domain